jgi:DNA-binding transcriptional ArsR family regulator
MLSTLITSKTRVRLLVKFFLNPSMKAYLRRLADEFGESTNSVRIELNRLTEAGLLESFAEGNTIMYQAKESYPLYPELKSIVTKITGIDQVIEEVIQRLGSLDKAYLVGDYAKGIDSGTIEVILVGKKVDEKNLKELIKKAEVLISRKINYHIFNEENFNLFVQENQPLILVLWNKLNK